MHHILMAHLAMAAFAHAAFHMALEAHVNAIVRNSLLAHFLNDESIHDRRPAQCAERIVGIDFQMLERLGDQAHFAIHPSS